MLPILIVNVNDRLNMGAINYLCLETVQGIVCYFLLLDCIYTILLCKMAEVWTNVFLTKFIERYDSHSNLYNVNCTNYKLKNKIETSYNAIGTIYLPNLLFNIIPLVSKINVAAKNINAFSALSICHLYKLI